MTTALIGYTGFVGSTLARSATFDGLFNSTNIESIAGHSFDLVVCAGARAEKWRINADPDSDTLALQRLTTALTAVRARQMVLISTVDVYPVPVGVDEDSWIDAAAGTAYGRHRFALEHFITTHFDALVIRLPGLFGPGLKKNIIFDLVHDHMLERLNAESRFQFYDVTQLWLHVQRARAFGLRLLNLATEPLSVSRIASEVFGRTLPAPASGPAVEYDMRSRNAHLFGGSNGYVQDADHVLRDLRAFAALHQRTPA
jgi:nucleoside-diphosphate-sugar epimerase